MIARENSVGFCNCPVCGETTDVRSNKNQKLYIICDNSHRIEFNAVESRKARALLFQSRDAECGNIKIYP